MTYPPQQGPTDWQSPTRRVPVRNKWKIAGIGCGGLFVLVIVLAIAGAIIGPPKKTADTAPLAVSTPSAAVTTLTQASRSQKPTAIPSSAASRPTTVAASATTTPQVIPPAAPKPSTHLVLSGGLAGTVSQAVHVQPVKTGAHYDYNVGDGITQCVMPANDGAWSANIAFKLKGINWQLTLDNGNSFGSPKSGKHVLIEAGNDNGTDPNDVGVYLASDQSPDGLGGGSGVGYGFNYYPPIDHGDGTITISSAGTAGTINAWFTPSEADSLEFHIVGKWACS